MAAITICSDFGAPQNKVWHCLTIYFPWGDGIRCHDLSFWMLSFKPTLSPSSSTFIRRLFSSSSLSAIRVSQEAGQVVCFPLFLCIDLWGRLSYLSWLFFGTLHSNGSIFPFLLCFSLLFFSQLFVRPPQTAILLSCISFPWGWS